MGVFLCECVETANVAKRGRIFFLADKQMELCYESICQHVWKCCEGQTWLPSTVCRVGLGLTVEEDGGLPPGASSPGCLRTAGPASSDWDDEKGRSRWWRWSGVGPGEAVLSS